MRQVEFHRSNEVRETSGVYHSTELFIMELDILYLSETIRTPNGIQGTQHSMGGTSQGRGKEDLGPFTVLW